MPTNSKKTKVDVDMHQPINFLAFGFGSGLSPIAPGTFGTLAAIPIYALLLICPFSVYLLFLVVSLTIGIWICGESSRMIGVHDHSGIVWDEIAGFLLTMVPFAPSVGSVIAGFLAFRFFDIIKPWPIRWFDRRIHGGFGIMLDDVIAAVFSIILLVTISLIGPGVLSQHVLLRSW
jgi:phosphatidylglycerophosphatase A